MIRRVLLLGMGIIVSVGSLSLSDPASAQDGRHFQRDPRFRQERPMQPGYPAYPGNPAYQVPERRFNPPQRPGGEDWGREGRQGGRMTPEERQQLRRDIFDAGRDVYRGRPDRPGRPRRD